MTQGMNLIKNASKNFEWGVDLGECARIWKGGCIIRAAFLDDIKRAYVRDPELDNLLVDPDFSALILERQASWRRVVTLCVASGIAAPAMTASLSYFDAYRRARLPANLVQVSCSKDFFCGFGWGKIPPLLLGFVVKMHLFFVWVRWQESPLYIGLRSGFVTFAGVQKWILQVGAVRCQVEPDRTARPPFDECRFSSLVLCADSQAQRDFFGAHTYERTDKEGTFHCLWDDTHKDIGDVTGRIAGEL